MRKRDLSSEELARSLAQCRRVVARLQKHVRAIEKQLGASERRRLDKGGREPHGMHLTIEKLLKQKGGLTATELAGALRAKGFLAGSADPVATVRVCLSRYPKFHSIERRWFTR